MCRVLLERKHRSILLHLSTEYLVELAPGVRTSPATHSACRVRCIFANFWKWICPEKLWARRRLIPESMVEDVLLAILSLPVCVADLRAEINRLVVASDVSEWGLGLSRTSSSRAPTGHPKIQRIGGFNRALRRVGWPPASNGAL